MSSSLHLPSAHQSRRWLANVLVGYGDALVGGVIYLFMTPLLIGALGADGYALWIVSHTLCFYLQFLDAGLGGAQVRYHARFSARQRSQDIQRLTSTTALGLTLAGIAAALIGASIALVPARWWTEVSASLQADFRLCLLLLATNLLVAFPSSALNNIYAAVQRYDIRNLRSIVLRAITSAAQLAAIHYGYGIVELAAIELVAMSVRTFSDVIIINRLCPGLLGSAVSFYQDTWQKIRRFALWSFADDVLVEGTPKLDTLFIAVVLPVGLLTPYSLCVTVAGLLPMIVHPVIDTLFPVATGFHARNHRTALRQLLATGSKLCLSVATPLAIFVAAFGNRLLALWVPESASLISSYVLPVMAMNAWVTVYLSVSSIILTAINGVRTVVLLTLLEIAANLILILILAPKLALLGVAIACLLTNICIGFGLQLPIVARVVGQQLSTLLVNSLLRVVAAAAPTLAITWTLAVKWPAATWTQLTAAAAVNAGVFLLAMLIVGTTAEERRDYLQLCRGLLHTSTVQA